MEEVGWTPAEESILESEVESKLAEMIEDDSLENLRKKSDSTQITEDIAKATRAAKGDRRLDTTPAEHEHAKQLTEVVSWVLVGITVVVVLAAAAFSILFGTSVF
jgi:cell division protein FtsX